MDVTSQKAIVDGPGKPNYPSPVLTPAGLPRTSHGRLLRVLATDPG